MSLHWYTCISINNYCFEIYNILLEMDWWVLSNTSSIVQIHSAVYGILANKAFIVTDGLISWLFVIAFVHSTCYELKSLELDKRTNSCIGVNTRELDKKPFTK